jgi:hypothetical protein
MSAGRTREGAITHPGTEALEAGAADDVHDGERIWHDAGITGAGLAMPEGALRVVLDSVAVDACAARQ